MNAVFWVLLGIAIAVMVGGWILTYLFVRYG